MGIGREVADAYISVHGDISSFRDSLNKAGGSLQDAAIKNSDKFAEAWDRNLANRITSSWGKLVDGLASGRQVDLNDVIKSFDPSDLDNASAKVHDLLHTMRDAGKMTKVQFEEVMKKVDASTKAMQRQAFLEADLDNDRKRWHNAQLNMMDALKAARKRDAETARKTHEEALSMNRIFDIARKKMMDDAIRDNEAFDRSFKGMLRSANVSSLEADFRKLADAVASADFSKFSKGFDDFAAMRRRVSEVTAAMHENGRISAEASQEAIDGINKHIGAQEELIRVKEADAEAIRLTKEAQDRFNKSFEGMIQAARKMDLDTRFKDLSTAMATMDFSKLARGAKDMNDLRIQTLQTAEEMRRMGRMTDEEFGLVEARINTMSQNMDAYNVRFRDANNQSTRHSRDWTIIQRMIGNAGKKFAGFSGLNVLSDVFQNGARFFQDLDRNAVKIGKMVTMAGTLASTVIQAIGGIAVIGQDLAAIGNLGILAPGFLTAMGIGIGVMVAALKDMGDVLADLGPKFGALQDSISTEFWAQAEQPIRNLVDSLFPTLQTQLAITASGMGALTGAFAAAFQGAATPERVTGMFEKMNSAITILTGAMEPLVQAFVTLGEVGSGYFERFASWIVDISERFNTFIQAAAADGRLNQWIETAITNLQAVGSIVGSLVGIWNSIGSAAESAGIGGLTTVATALEGIAEVMNSADFQHTLTLLFSGAAAASRDVGQAIADLGPAIEQFMPTVSAGLEMIGSTASMVIGYIGELMSNPAIQAGLTAFLTGIHAGVAALGPAIGPMGDSLGQVMELLGQVAGIVGELVSALIINLSPVLDTITEAFGRITFAAGPEIVKIIETLSGVVGNLVDTLLPPIENLIMTLLPLIAPLFAALTPVIDAVVGVLGIVVGAIGQLVEMIAPYLVPAFEKISAAVAPIIEVLGKVVEFILSILVPILGFLLIGIINNVVGVFQGLSNFIMGFVEIVTAIFTGFGAFFTKLFQGDFIGALNALGTMFGSIWDGIVQMLGGALEFLWNAVQLLFIGKLVVGIKGALTGIGAFFKSTWDDILNFFKNMMTNLGTANSTIWNTIKGTITSVWNTVWGFLRGVLDDILGFFRSVWDNVAGTVQAAVLQIQMRVMSTLGGVRGFIDDAMRFVQSVFQTAWQVAVNAVSTGVSTILNFVRNIPGQIGSYLSGLGNLLWNAGKGIIDGLLNGLKASWGAVTSFVGGIASWIRDNKGPLPYDRALLIPAGNAIMEGLGNGLMDKLTMLKGILNTVTDTMTDSVTQAFAKSKMYVAGADAALGLADGLRANKRVVADALTAVMPAADSSVGVRVSGTGAGVAAPAAAGTIINVQAGAIPVSTPTKDPELVASKVIDGFANYSNL